MQSHIGLLLFFAFLFQSAVAGFCQDKHNPSASALYQQGMVLSREGNTQQAIEVLEAAVKIDPKFAEAYHALALQYMNLETVHGRFLATQVLEHALRLDKDNVEYKLDMARLLVQKGMKRKARKRIEAVLKLDSSNVAAHYELGLLYEKYTLEYMDLMAFHGSTVTSFTGFTTADIKKALKHFRKVVELAPNFAQVYYHMALISHEVGNYRTMVSYLKRALAAEPTNKDFYQFLGLALHRLGDDKSAHKNFKLAQKYMSEEDRKLFDSVLPLLNPSMKNEYLSSSGEAQNQYETAFWKKRDPLFLTEVNERVLEHYSRLAYVNLRFGRPGKHVSGWETDRGQTYVRFGPPNWQRKVREEMSGKGNAESEQGTFFVLGRPPRIGGFEKSSHLNPSDVRWQYQGFSVVFEDEFLTGNFQFKRGLQAERHTRYGVFVDDFKADFEKRIEHTPETYDFDLGGSKLELVHSILQFKGDKGRTRIELFCGIPATLVTLYQQAGQSLMAAKAGVFVFDEEWQPIRQSVGRLPPGLATVANVGGVQYKLARDRMQLKPGQYNIAIEVVDEKNGNMGTLRKSLSVRQFSETGLDISDLLLADTIREKSGSSLYELGEFDIIPNLFRGFFPRQSILAYFELYNLSLDGEGHSHYRIETFMSLLKQGQGDLSKLMADISTFWASGETAEAEVSTSFEYYGTSTDEAIHASMQLADARSGIYLLTVKVTDLDIEQSVVAQGLFEIYDSEN